MIDHDVLARGIGEDFYRAAFDAAMEQRNILRDALAAARPYVYNRPTDEQPWRAETARSVLAQVDAALEQPPRAPDAEDA